MDELADQVRMDPLEFRLKNLPPGGAERDVAEVLPDGGREVRLEQAASDRRSDAGPDQARHRLRGQPVGRRRARHAAHCEIMPDGGVVDALRHAGHRHRHAHARRDDHRRDARPAARRRQGGDRRQRLSVQRRQRRQHTAASVSPAIRVAAGKALDALAARRSRRRSASTPATLVAQGRPRSRRRTTPSKGLDVEGGLQAARHRADRGRRRVGAGPVGERHERRAVRRGRGGHRDRRRRRSSACCACRTAASSSTS